MFSPGGEVIESAGLEPNTHRRRINDKYHDAASGLSYFGHRYYDAVSLQWTQGDPKHRTGPDLKMSEPRRRNLYSYNLNNSLRFVDPDGRDPETDKKLIEEWAAIMSDINRLVPQPISSRQGVVESEGLGWIVEMLLPHAATADMIYDTLSGDSDSDSDSDLDADSILDGFSKIPIRGLGGAFPMGPGASARPGAGQPAGAVGRAEARAGVERANNLKKGIPAKDLGPSGKPKIHAPEHSSRKAAKDAARAKAGKGGTTLEHSNPRRGGPHFHGVDKKGIKDRVHHEYPEYSRPKPKYEEKE
jgi:RHS repeat-associated protein